MYITYVCLATTTPPFNLFPFSCMSSGCCTQQQFLMSWCVVHDCISLLKNHFHGWLIYGEEVALTQQSFLRLSVVLESEALSQASSHFNVDVQKLLFILFCAHSSEDWLSRTVQNREKRQKVIYCQQT